MKRKIIISIIALVSVSLIIFIEGKENKKKILVSVTLEDTLINHQFTIGLSYEKLTELMGEPIDIKYIEVLPHATMEPQHFAIAIYKNIEIEFDLGFNPNVKKLEDSQVFRFDITGNEIPIGELKVGMSINDIPGLSKKIIKLENLNTEDYNQSEVYKILHDLKEEGRYSQYKEGIYIKGTIIEKEMNKYNWGLAFGYVALIKDGKIERFVFGYPTAG